LIGNIEVGFHFKENRLCGSSGFVLDVFFHVLRIPFGLAYRIGSGTSFSIPHSEAGSLPSRHRYTHWAQIFKAQVEPSISWRDLKPPYKKTSCNGILPRATPICPRLLCIFIPHCQEVVPCALLASSPGMQKWHIDGRWASRDTLRLSRPPQQTPKKAERYASLDLLEPIESSRNQSTWSVQLGDSRHWRRDKSCTHA
jgi:hypothetical protein